MISDQPIADATPLIKQVVALMPGVTVMAVTTELFDTIHEFCKETQALRGECLEVLPANVNAMSLASDGNLAIIKVLTVQGQDGLPLAPRPEMLQFMVPNVSGSPTRFACPQPDRIVFNALPAEDFRFRATVALTPICSSSQYPAVLFNQYYDAIKSGLEGKLFAQPAKSYTNAREALKRLNAFKAYKGYARINAEQANTLADPPWRYPRWA